MSDLQCAARLLISRPGEPTQAHALGGSLSAARVSTIYCSSEANAVRTAEIVASRLGVAVRVRDNLRERSGVEPDEEVRRRIAEELEMIVDLHRGETILVVSHDRAIRTAVPALVRNVTDDYGTTHEVESCGVVEVDADSDGWVLRSWCGAKSAES